MPRGSIPDAVERYVREIRRQSPHYPEQKVWAVAWSRFCRYKDPGSRHCRRRSRALYFPGRRDRKALSRRKQRRYERRLRARRYHPNVAAPLAFMVAGTLVASLVIFVLDRSRP